jgi:hypothetical protein
MSECAPVTDGFSFHARQLFEQLKATPHFTMAWVHAHRRLLRELKLPEWTWWALLSPHVAHNNADIDRTRAAYRFLNGGQTYECYPVRTRRKKT